MPRSSSLKPRQPSRSLIIDIRYESGPPLYGMRIAFLFFAELLEQAIDCYRVAISARKKLMAVVDSAARIQPESNAVVR